ncbi:MAG: glutathionylspermidine synthase [Nautilia sp.]|nr:MAG: glutathionylspermidine synthase [Nautilia sp.]
MKLLELKPLSKEYLESIGFYWHTDKDLSDYIDNKVVVITPEMAENYANAVNELYDMFIEAAQYVIDNNLFYELDIPFNLVDIIKESWENDVHWHLYGRFDLAGGINKPIKLIEFNADTPTALFESSIIQWALLKANGIDEGMQFNFIYEALRDNFKRLATLDENIDNFDEVYEGWKILFSSVKGNLEEENTTRLLQSIAEEAGWNTNFAYIDEIEFSDEGVFFEGEKYEFLFKLIPWEAIAIEEPELAEIMTNIVKNKQAIFLNPAYTLLFQSKGIMKILWDLYPNHPLLLETSFEPLENKKQVIKPTLAREGANIEIIDENREVLAKEEGEYNNFKKVYQEFVELEKDEEGNYYQAGVFFAYEACGLGYRKGGLILNNLSKFVGHIVEE